MRKVLCAFVLALLIPFAQCEDKAALIRAADEPIQLNIHVETSAAPAPSQELIDAAKSAASAARDAATDARSSTIAAKSLLDSSTTVVAGAQTVTAAATAAVNSASTATAASSAAPPTISQTTANTAATAATGSVIFGLVLTGVMYALQWLQSNKGIQVSKYWNMVYGIYGELVSIGIPMPAAISSNAALINAKFLAVFGTAPTPAQFADLTHAIHRLDFHNPDTVNGVPTPRAAGSAPTAIGAVAGVPSIPTPRAANLPMILNRPN
jgi:hypothetical protein